jgi:hypothetical protein
MQPRFSIFPFPNFPWSGGFSDVKNWIDAVDRFRWCVNWKNSQARLPEPKLSIASSSSVDANNRRPRRAITVGRTVRHRHLDEMSIPPPVKILTFVFSIHQQFSISLRRLRQQLNTAATMEGEGVQTELQTLASIRDPLVKYADDVSWPRNRLFKC